ncbi:MAG: sugar transferase [Acetobacteraceae bacterium]|nr:sugar transferase [Acetobacteraceae bacterium]
MYERFGKRLLDIALAALLLVLAAPLLAGTALAVALALGRPVLFRQVRAGRHGRPFTLVKFRSMADGRGPDAARLTRFGQALRASGLDELPQLVNVLRGEMSLVGPRPLPLDYVALYSRRQRLRLVVRPGLAGLAQAAGRNTVPWPERLELDVRYAGAGAGLRTDLAILARCLGVVLRGRGAAAAGHATMPAFTGTEPALQPPSRSSAS